MQTLTKEERLRGKFAIEDLYKKGRFFQTNCFKVYWIEVDQSTFPAQFLVSIPKRAFKRAVDRNRLKRLTRESFRKNKLLFYEKLNSANVHLMFVYTKKKIVEYEEIEKNMLEVFRKICEHLSKKSGTN